MFDDARLRAESANFRLAQYQDEIILEVVNETVLPICRSFAKAANLPEKFVKHIEAEKIAFRKVRIGSTWKEQRRDAVGTVVPLGKYFEDGTRDNVEIRPLDPDGVLAFPATASFPQFDAVKGSTDVTAFAKVVVRKKGLPRYQPIKRGILAALPTFSSQMKIRSDKFLKETSLS